MASLCVGQGSTTNQGFVGRDGGPTGRCTRTAGLVRIVPRAGSVRPGPAVHVPATWSWLFRVTDCRSEVSVCFPGIDARRVTGTLANRMARAWLRSCSAPVNSTGYQPCTDCNPMATGRASRNLEPIDLRLSLRYAATSKGGKGERHQDRCLSSTLPSPTRGLGTGPIH